MRYSACFLNDTNDPTTSQHAWVLSFIDNNVDPGCAPQSTPQSFTCTTDASGFCTRPAASGGPAGGGSYLIRLPTKLRRKRHGLSVSRSIDRYGPRQTPQVQPIQVVPRGSNHQTGTIISCATGTTSQAQVYARPNRVFAISTDHVVAGNVGQPTTCTVFVMDLEPNTAFDATVCAPPYTGTHCNVDYQDVAAPIGQVAFTTDPSNSLSSPQCTLSSRASAAPAGVPVHPWGARFYGSWCSITVTPSTAGTSNLGVTYNGSTGDLTSDPTVSFFPPNPAAPLLQLVAS